MTSICVRHWFLTAEPERLIYDEQVPYLVVIHSVSSLVLVLGTITRYR
jgi:hypothetical protein